MEYVNDNTIFRNGEIVNFTFIKILNERLGEKIYVYLLTNN